MLDPFSRSDSAFMRESLEIARDVYRSSDFVMLSGMVSAAVQTIDADDGYGIGLALLRAIQWARAEWQNDQLDEPRP